mmetsp:Transcript_33685/g.84566  ORF Transcript_33685/g.84566 Transcript_33685/m.84566 type:complete len:472 (-) Transcript_33685:93-1508(-)
MSFQDDEASKRRYSVCELGGDKLICVDDYETSPQPPIPLTLKPIHAKSGVNPLPENFQLPTAKAIAATFSADSEQRVALAEFLNHHLLHHPAAAVALTTYDLLKHLGKFYLWYNYGPPVKQLPKEVASSSSTGSSPSEATVIVDAATPLQQFVMNEDYMREGARQQASKLPGQGVHVSEDTPLACHPSLAHDIQVLQKLRKLVGKGVDVCGDAAATLMAPSNYPFVRAVNSWLQWYRSIVEHDPAVYDAFLRSEVSSLKDGHGQAQQDSGLASLLGCVDLTSSADTLAHSADTNQGDVHGDSPAAQCGADVAAAGPCDGSQGSPADAAGAMESLEDLLPEDEWVVIDLTKQTAVERMRDEARRRNGEGLWSERQRFEQFLRTKADALLRGLQLDQPGVWKTRLRYFHLVGQLFWFDPTVLLGVAVLEGLLLVGSLGPPPPAPPLTATQPVGQASSQQTDNSNQLPCLFIQE